MEKLSHLLFMKESHNEYDAYCYTLSQAPRAYRRALAAYQCIQTRHPWNQVLAVSLRDGEINDGFTPVNLVLYSVEGVFNSRSYELVIPAFEKEGIIYIDDIEDVAHLRTSSSHRSDSGYVYVYPITVKAVLSPLLDALTFMAGVSAAEEGVIEKAYDQEGWLYAGKNTKTTEELIGWYLENNANYFAQEARKEQDNNPYWAFTSNDQNEDQEGKMFVLGERLRELDPAPWGCEQVFHELQMPDSLYDTLVPMSHRDTHIMLDSIGITGEGKYLARDIRSVMSEPEGVEVFESSFIKIAEFTLDGPGVWEKTTVRFKFYNNVGDVEGEVFREGKNYNLPDRLAKGILRGILVKKGIQQACSAGLVTLDERENEEVPLNERELPYEEYLRMGVEWLNPLLEKAKTQREENQEDSEQLSDWERALLEGEEA